MEARPKIDELVGEVVFDIDPKLLKMAILAKSKCKTLSASYIKLFAYCGVRLIRVDENAAMFEPLNGTLRECIQLDSRFDENLAALLVKYPVGDEGVRTIGISHIFGVKIAQVVDLFKPNADGSQPSPGTTTGSHLRVTN